METSTAPSNTCRLDPPDSASQTASLSVQPCLHSSRQRVLTLYTLQWFRHFCLSKLFLCMGDLPPPYLLHDSLCPLESASRTATQSSVQPLLQGSRSDQQTDRQTDRLTTTLYSVCSNRAHLDSAAMRPMIGHVALTTHSLWCLLSMLVGLYLIISSLHAEL